MTTRIKLRRDTATNWSNANPVLALGEAGYDSDNNALRIGDGTTHWNDLTPIASSSGTVQGDSVVLGSDYNNAYIEIDQDNPYIRIYVQSTTSNNYRSEMLWHNPWYSRYNKIYTNAYGVHIQNAQWGGPGNDYFNRFSFTRDGVLNLPPSATIRSNDWQNAYWYDPISNNYINDDQPPMGGMDNSLTLEANTVSISRGSLSMNGTSLQGNAWIAMTGDMGNQDFSTWKDSACLDKYGNVYTIDGSETPGPGSVCAVTKFDGNGNRVWQRVLYVSEGSPAPYFDTYGAGISYNEQHDRLYVTVNDYGNFSGNGNDTVVAFQIDTDGEQSDGAIGVYSPTQDLEINDSITSKLYDDLVYVGVGRAGNGHAILDIAQQIGQKPAGFGNSRLVVSTATFGGGITPSRETLDNWFMFGPGLTGNVAINSVNQVGVLATRVSGSGTGSDASFAVTFDTDAPYTASMLQTGYTGSNYADDDLLKISGEALGGASPANDLTFNPVTDGGAIIGFANVAGTSSSVNMLLGLQDDPVDFYNIATPQIFVNSSTDSLIVSAGWFGSSGGPVSYTLGNVGWDTLNAVAQDTTGTDGNIYVGGRYHPYGNSHPRKSILAKIMPLNGYPQIVWAKQVDDYTGRNEVFGVDVDSTGHVYTLAVNNNYDAVVTKVTSEGVMVWQRLITQYTFSENDHDSYGIAVDGNDRIIVTGAATRGDDFDGGNVDILVVAFDIDGNTLYARTLGTPQDEWAHRDRTRHNIQVLDNTMVISGDTTAGGFRQTHPGLEVGFVAKLPTDGTGIGHYGEWRYIPTPVEVQVVSNTAANAAPTFNWTSNDIQTFDNAPIGFANVATLGGPEFAYPGITYQIGGTGEINGINTLAFTNGALIRNAEEEGLMLWQPEPTKDQLYHDRHNAEYIALAYGGPDAEDANVMISAGSYNWGDDDDNLNFFYYSSSEAAQAQRQVNIDIRGKHSSGTLINFSNWHFDENGSLYLPAQSGMYFENIFVSGNADVGGGMVRLTIPKAGTSTLGSMLYQDGTTTYIQDYNSNASPTIITAVSDDDYNWYVNVDSSWYAATFYGGTDRVNLNNQFTNGIVFNDRSKQTTAGDKYIHGNSPNNVLDTGRKMGWLNGTNETLVWMASATNVNAFRGTFRFQCGDPSLGLKIYDITGGQFSGGGSGGGQMFDSQEILNVHASVTGSMTFRLDRSGGVLKLYATNPAGINYSYCTHDVTEFGYTSD